jgi:prepilin-type N-terminal cleavage/methylation domain-containing protein
MNLRRHSGFSLVELMISIALGLLLTAGIVTLFQSTLHSNRNLASGKQLEGELHATLDLISRDLRRAGAMGDPLRQLLGLANPFGTDTASAYPGEAADSCLTFSYDFNGNGSLETSAPDERFGYRLRQGVVQARVEGQGCTANTTPVWKNVSTPAVVEVTTLQFTLVPASNGGVVQRVAHMSIAGRLVQDHAVTRSLSRTVRLRNDGYAP